ncbi:hypothetical protein F5J12DRAFT_466648 [Pisolithus orientalis]|uniref:uncharacterized protein n=1 Tax=Pisolithus orientalis TaxID=936130 RepID=UPI00222475BF|nr:uncharacterized protein F5J12DRAFT_466648 [Pisolithus orientalis]KAI5991689.1 hypothetical protein F5J12DRAFT_466648 [Pisolithus orientalis]
MRLIKIKEFLARHRQVLQQADVDTQTQIFTNCDDTTTKYCILSHRWIAGHEVDYVQMMNLAKLDDAFEILNLHGYQKILKACDVADGHFEYLWADTCCIDKRNSSELSEAINSMFRWYKNSTQCYTYLHDTSDFPTQADSATFTNSNGWPEWFSRGWTLQELIAPAELHFFNRDWKEIGDKRNRATELEKITGVPARVLMDGLSSYSPSFAEVMSWAAERRTTLAEDEAYSLIGLLGVHMPMLYGEGKKAFQRLQLEFMRMSNDQSVFAWRANKAGGTGAEESSDGGSTKEEMGWTSSVLADGPIAFRGCHDIIQMEPKEFYRLLSKKWESGAKVLAGVGADEECKLPAFTVTNLGIRIRLPLTDYYGCPSIFQVALTCRRKNNLMPLTIDLAAFGHVYYRYSGADGPIQPFPRSQKLDLAYQDGTPRGITFKLVETTALHGFRRRLIFPPNTTCGNGSLKLSSTNPLAIVVYANDSNTFFAVACGYCFGQDWVHVICDEPRNKLPANPEEIYKRIWNRGAEYARLMTEACSGKVVQPYHVKHGYLLGTIWAIRIACGGWEKSNDRIVAVDVVEFPGGRCKTLTWEPMYGTKGLIKAEIPCLMRETLWFGGRLDDHRVEGTHEVFSLAPIQQSIKVGDYGVIVSNNTGNFKRLGNIFEEQEASNLKLRLYTNDLPLKPVVTSRLVAYGTSLPRPSENAGLILNEPKIISFLNTPRVLDLLKQLSTRMRDYSLVTSVVQCSACALTDDFRGRIKTQMRRYPESWQGYARNVTTNPQTVTPLYTIATPWVWYQGELNRDVASEYHEIRKRFNVIKNYPPAHRSEFRHEAMEFFKAKFGVVHLEDLVGNITFFEHLASISGKHIQGPNTTFLDSSPSDLPKTLQESRGKELVVELVGAMRGVTHCRGDTWLSVVTKLVSTMKKLTNTLALEFLEDICNTFPEKGQSLDSFIKERKSNYNVADR